MLIKTKHAQYKVLEDLGILVNKELIEEFSDLVPKPPNKDHNIKILEKQLTDSQILESLTQCSSMALVTTESCNFRCKYCSYSGKYPNERVHSDKSMNVETAAKAVDLFYKLVTGKNRNNKEKDLTITFYGGESLLEFKLVRETIEYVEKEARENGLNKLFEIHFRLNTNGYLLSGSVVDFFKEKDVHLDVSLDGPAEQHDRFRVTGEGIGTWNRIMTNLKNLKQKYPDYYRRRVHYLATMHPLHDSGEIDRFFSQTLELFQDKLPKFGLVSTMNLEQEEAEVLDKIKFKPGKLYTDRIFQDLAIKYEMKSRGSGLSLTGTCFPGAEKIQVNCDGSLSICEKISHLAPKLGDVERGFDFNSIRTILKEYGKQIIESQCWQCPVWFLCDVCIAKAFDGNHFSFDCSVKKAHSQLLMDYLEEKEEKENQEYNPQCNSVVDFIEQL